MPSVYRKWMYNWETRLANRDNNRVVRPLDWGLDWTRSWPGSNGLQARPADPENTICSLNQRILANSDEFFGYRTPSDFRLESGIADQLRSNSSATDKAAYLVFTSRVFTPYPQNNMVHARWFPASGRRAVMVLPQWNADAESHNGLCRIFNFLGISALRLSLPYHDLRKPPEIERADYAVSANIGRTIDAARQAVIDVRCCLDWLEQNGYSRFGIVGTSLGSCYAFIASAHDPRLAVCAFNHASTYFADVVWTGQSTRHIRTGIESGIDLERLRKAWLAISPMSYFDQFSRYTRRSLVTYATYDLTFPPELSREIIAEFRRRGLTHEVRKMPCGHYSSGENPFKYLDAYYLASFLRRGFAED